MTFPDGIKFADVFGPWDGLHEFFVTNLSLIPSILRSEGVREQLSSSTIASYGNINDRSAETTVTNFLNMLSGTQNPALYEAIVKLGIKNPSLRGHLNKGNKYVCEVLGGSDNTPALKKDPRDHQVVGTPQNFDKGSAGEGLGGNNGNREEVYTGPVQTSRVANTGPVQTSRVANTSTVDTDTRGDQAGNSSAQAVSGGTRYQTIGLFSESATVSGSECTRVVGRGHIPKGARCLRVEWDIEAHDQGWSIFPNDHGTKVNSYTWFEVTFILPARPLAHQLSKTFEIDRNILAKSDWTKYHHAWDENHQFVLALNAALSGRHPADAVEIQLVMRAHPGQWTNFAKQFTGKFYLAV